MGAKQVDYRGWTIAEADNPWARKYGYYVVFWEGEYDGAPLQVAESVDEAKAEIDALIEDLDAQEE